MESVYFYVVRWGWGGGNGKGRERVDGVEGMTQNRMGNFLAIGYENSLVSHLEELG